MAEKETWAEAMVGNTAAVKHGMHAIERRGSVALPEVLRGRERELIERLATHEGLLAELEGVALKYLSIVEAGCHWLTQIVEAGGNPWRMGTDRKPEPALRSLATYLAGAQRTLGKLAELRGDKDTLDLPTLLAQEVGDAEDAGD